MRRQSGIRTEPRLPWAAGTVPTDRSATPPSGLSYSPSQLSILLLILVVAAGLRFYALGWGFPCHLHCDETKLAGVTVRLGERVVNEHSLNPEFSAYGALPMYLTLLGAPLARLGAAIQGFSYTPIEAVTLTGRALSALADTAAVYLVFLLGSLAGRRSGLWAAALYAVTVLGIREAHFYTPDALASCLVLLYVYLVWYAWRTQTRWGWALAGIGLGLAISVKSAALPLLLVALVAWGLVARDAVGRGGDPKVFRMMAAARLLRGGLAFLMLLSVLPAIGWGMSRSRIIAYGGAQLASNVDATRIASHAPEYWTGQVEATYNGMLRLLIALAVVGVFGGLAVLGALTGERGPRLCYEARARLDGLGMILAGTLGTFVLLNPYSLLQPLDYWAPKGPDYLVWNILMANGAFWPPPGWMLGFVRTWPYAYQLVHVMPYVWGPALMVLLLVALVWGVRALVRRELPHLWPALLTMVLLALMLAGLRMKMARYLLPLTPLLCVVAGAMLARMTARLPGRRPALAWAAGALVIAVSLGWSVGYVGLYGRTDNRVAAVQWLTAQTTAADKVVYEKDDAWGAAGEAAIRGAVAGRTERLEPIRYTHDHMGETVPEQVAEEKRAYLQSVLGDATVLVMTDTNTARLGRLRKEFPQINAFYDSLRSGASGFSQVAAFTAGPRFLWWPINDAGAESSIRLFDHPQVRIYRRGGATRPS